LTVSGQLNAEAYACAMGKVYTFGPTFRAEKSNTSRHLSEFWMIEPEIAFADIEETMDLAEEFVKSIVKGALRTCDDELGFFEKNEKYLSKSERKKGQGGFYSLPLRQRLDSVANKTFTRISYTEAITILQKKKKKFEQKPEWGIDLSSEHENYLTLEQGGPTIVYDYPQTIKPFYMRVNEDSKTVAGFDLLLPGIGELIGGGAREEREDKLMERMKDSGLEQSQYEWYLDLRRFGSVPHAGFGLGLERILLFLTGLDNIRDVIPFPRYPNFIEF